MKKIFTCISLAAATFMATTPVMAQQQKQLTDKEKQIKKRLLLLKLLFLPFLIK